MRCDCGVELPANANFCASCGKAVGNRRDSTAATPTDANSSAAFSKALGKRSFFRWSNWVIWVLACFGILVVLGAIGSALEEDSPTTGASTQGAANKAKPAPTVTPIPRQVGLGVSRTEIQRLFGSAELGFVFENSPLADGTPRLLGTSPNGLTLLELQGPSHNLMTASMLVGLPNDSPEAVLFGATYMLGLIANVLPGWAGGPDWLSNNMERVARGTEASTTRGDATVTLTLLNELGMLSLVIEAQ